LSIGLLSWGEELYWIVPNIQGWSQGCTLHRKMPSLSTGGGLGTTFQQKKHYKELGNSMLSISVADSNE
jgi:hypothetical protein